MDRPVTRPPLRRLALWVFWGLVPLVLGIVLAVLAVPVPKVAVIRFEGIIWGGSVSYLGEMLDRALDDRSIRAVVLAIDSPGGDVAATEELYYRLLDLRLHKPLVVSIDYVAASGGYYMAAAGEYVYAKPTSLVGNVGEAGTVTTLAVCLRLRVTRKPPLQHRNDVATRAHSGLLEFRRLRHRVRFRRGCRLGGGIPRPIVHPDSHKQSGKHRNDDCPTDH